MGNFLRVPQKIHNAVILMVDLAESYDSGRFLSLSEVAEKNYLSKGFLEEVTTVLKMADLVVSRRGSTGGYRLKKHPADISVGEIVLAMEGEVALTECLGGTGCALAGKCVTQKIWTKVQNKVEESLFSISLDGLIKEQDELN